MHSERTLVCYAQLSLAPDPAGTDRRGLAAAVRRRALMVGPIAMAANRGESVTLSRGTQSQATSRGGEPSRPSGAGHGTRCVGAMRVCLTPLLAI